MKRLFFILTLFFTCGPCFAQPAQNKDLTHYYIQQSLPCGGIEALFKQKGSWTKLADAGPFPDKTFPSNQYPYIFSRIEKIVLLLKEAVPDLNGMAANWYRSINGNSMVANGPVPYQLLSSYPEYFCSSEKKIELNAEPEAHVNIYVNEYNNWFAKKIDNWNINGEGKMIAEYQMPDTVGKWHGVKVYEPKIIHGQFDRAIVFGHNGKMPWFTLSQKQYLTGYTNYLEGNRKEQLYANDTYIKNAKENIANMQASKALTAGQKKVVVEELEQQLKDYQNKKMPENIAATQKKYEEQLKPVKEYLDTASATTLAQQAILDIKCFTTFKGYFAQPGTAGIKLIAFPAKYFNQQLPRYVPRFMIVYWRWGAHPANLKFASTFEDNFPVEKLQALVDQ